MDRTRALGVALGVAILVSVFTLPFSYRGLRPLSFFEVFEAAVQFMYTLPGEYLPLGYAYPIAFILLLAAGVLGVLPMVSGAISLFAMAFLGTIVYAYGGASMGLGYYVLWGVSLAAFANGYWRRFKALLTEPKYSTGTGADMELTSAPVAYAAMLIRRPAAEVFNAFIDPEVTTKFWFTKGSGKLEEGRKVTWAWEMYGVSAEVTAKRIEADKRILMEWGNPGSPVKRVEWVFTPHGDSTFVEVTESGFPGDGDAVVKAALDSTGGFTWVLAGAKAWLEHGVRLNLVADRFPHGK